MIFVILGTQDKQFKRLLNEVEKIETDEEIIVQSGYTKFTSNRMKIFDYLDMEEFDKYIKQADLIICHGGVGTIMTALKNHKVIISSARLSKYGEHQNDHQLQLLKPFSDNGFLLQLEDGDDINELYKLAKTFKTKDYIENNQKFIDLVRNKINNL